MKGSKWKFLTQVLLFVLIVVVVCSYRIYEQQYISYTDFIAYIDSGEVTKVVMHGGSSSTADVVMTDGKTRLVRVPSVESLTEVITEKNVTDKQLEFEINDGIDGWEFAQSAIRTIVKIFVFATVFAVISICLHVHVKIRRATEDDEDDEDGDDDDSFSEKLDIFGTSKFAQEATSNVKFSDVAGIDEEKAQLQEIVEFLKNPKRYQDMGAKVPKGILLTGMPGTGKTLLAKAIAGEAGVPFFQVTGSTFEEQYVGVGASRVRSLFKRAKAKAPSIIFIDEIDAVGIKRYSKNTYTEQTLNQLLAEMDGFNGDTGVIVIAATNHDEVLDEAITRPGRFDRKIYIPMPDSVARKEILEVHAKSKKISEELSFDEIAKKTMGFSGADLQNLLNEAAILAVNRDAKSIEKKDVEEAFVRVIVGLEKKNRPRTDEDKYHTAIHEAGHAIINIVLRPDAENLGISIIPRGDAGGYNLFCGEERSHYTEEDAIEKIAVCYGGKAAEEVILKKTSSGPENDLKQASEIAHNMVNRYGMKGTLLTQIGDEEYDSVLIKMNMEAAKKICEDVYEKAKKIIIQNEEVLKALADLLMKKETMSAEEVKDFIRSHSFLKP